MRWNRRTSDEAWARIEGASGSMEAMEHDPLAAYLDALARDDCYRVERVLKRAPHETTEVVSFVGANEAALGPFVRKRIGAEAGMGAAYGLLRDAQRAGRRFRHLPRIYDVHERDGELVVVMEYVAGRTLREEVYARDASLELAREWFPPLCDAVTELHEGLALPLVHRDLKPSNVLVSPGGLTLIDFGIARAWREGAEEDTTHFGTRSYAPPEQFGFRQTDCRSDVYALGMILYYLLTERDPSPAVAAAGFAEGAIPPSLRPVLARACAFDPAARFPSARDLKAAFLAAGSAAAPGGPAASSVAGMSGAPGMPVPRAMSPLETGGSEVPSGPAAAPACAGRLPVPDSGAVVSSGAPAGRFASRVRGAFSTLEPTETAGVVWDAVLLALWALFALAVAVLPFSPDDAYASWPLGLRMLLYWTFGYPFFTGILFIAADVRVVRRMAPAAWLLAGSRLRALGIVLVVAGVLSVGASMALAHALGLPT